MLDQIVVDRQGIARCIVDRIGQAGMHRGFGKRPFKEKASGRQAPVRGGIEQSRQLQPGNERCNRGLGAQAQQAAYRRVGWQRPMAGVVILQSRDI